MPPDPLLQRLKNEIRGDVLTDHVSRGLYATDASMYQIMPLAVVAPLDRADALRAVRICGEERAPIVPRGGGTSLSGQSIAAGVVIDFSKYMRRVLEVDENAARVRVEPGIVRDELNVLIKRHGLHFAPDPSTANRANIGGMIANNSGGMRSNKYGTTINHVLALDIALPTGEVLNLQAVAGAELERKCALPDREGEIYRGVRRIVSQHRREIETRFSKARRRSSGYMLDFLLETDRLDLCRLLSASEGTLGVVLEATLNLEPIPKASGLCVVHFETISQCLRALQAIVAFNPSSVEMLDHIIIDLARESLLGRDLCYFIEGHPAAVLIVEFDGEEKPGVEARLCEFAAAMREHGIGYAHPLMLDKQGESDVWSMRRNGLGLMTTIKGDRKPVPFVEDASMPLDQLADYIEAVRAVCERHKHPVSVYAHAGVGLCHVRPMLDLHRRDELALMEQIAEEVFELVLKHKGSLSGEHGDGMVRGGFNERYFGPRLYAAFKEIKALFDPLGLLNPGKIVDAPRMTDNLRFGPEYHVRHTASLFHFREDGGLRQAVEQCTGVGACRKTLGGTMCPSYIATRNEADSTRGRGNALRLAITGQLGPNPFGSDELRDVFDLCLSCKACKAECPNGVDMAKLKSEYLHARHAAVGIRFRERLFAGAHQSAQQAAGPLAPLVNGLLKVPVVRWGLDRLTGIDARRALPRYASQKLSSWWAQRPSRPAGQRGRVILFNDTYIEHHEPAIGRSAIEVLEAAGYEVLLANAGCCQRPAISKGLLDVARREGANTLRALDAMAPSCTPILVIEPSCASALADDLPDLIEDAALGARIAGRMQLLDNFLGGLLATEPDALPWKADPQARQILVHGHCHQKALFKTNGTLNLLAAIPGAQVALIDAGCCGMAGSFGYEKEHYDISLKIGEDRLFPRLRKALPSEQIAAPGFSCRHQIADAVQREARHPIEYLRDAMNSIK